VGSIVLTAAHHAREKVSTNDQFKRAMAAKMDDLDLSSESAYFRFAPPCSSSITVFPFAVLLISNTHSDKGGSERYW
jgi:hypothetical protein